jgi:hypothetical protein
MAHEIVETLEAIEPRMGAPPEASTPPFGGDSSNADPSSLAGTLGSLGVLERHD